MQETCNKPAGRQIGFLWSCGLALAGLLVALLVAEICVRLFVLGKLNKAPWNDRPKRYFLPQDYEEPRLNGPNISAKTPGTFRIAVIGDSFTFGPSLQYDDTFPARMDRWLNLNAKQPKVEVLNLSVCGLATAQEVSLLERALKAGVDLVILQITLNDPELKLNQVHYLQGQEYVRSLGQAYPVLKHWKSLSLVLARLHNLRTHQKYIDFYQKLYSTPQSWDLFAASLKRMADLTREKNVPFMAVIFPLFSHPFDQRYPFSNIHKQIGAELDSLSVPSLDLLKSYEGLPPERLQAFPAADLHPNEIAHRIAAERIIAKLRKEKLIPADVLPLNMASDRPKQASPSRKLRPPN